MNVFTMPTIKSVSELDSNTQSVSVTFGLVDRTGQSFDYTRDVNAVLNNNDNTLNPMDTMQRCYQVLAGLIAKCSIGVISKKQQDDYIAQQAAAKKAAEEAQEKYEAQQKAAAEAQKAAEAEAAAAKEAADTASSDQAKATAAQSDATNTQQTTQSASTTAPAA